MGRFISPDSVVQDPFDPQTLNRYAYCRNNPIIYTDPSGHIVWYVPVIIGAVVGALSAAIQTDGDGDAILKGALIGAASAGVGFGVGSAVSTLSGSTLAGAVVGGAAAGATGAALSGGNIGQGALFGAIGGLVAGAVGGLNIGGTDPNVYGITVQIAAAGVTSGIMAELSGAKFSQGMIPGMIGAAASSLGAMIEEANAGKGITEVKMNEPLDISSYPKLVENESDAGVQWRAKYLKQGTIDNSPKAIAEYKAQQREILGRQISDFFGRLLDAYIDAGPPPSRVVGPTFSIKFRIDNPGKLDYLIYRGAPVYPCELCHRPGHFPK